VKINYTGEAFSSLIQIVNYIESTNTKGAGMRWLNRYELFLKKKLHKPESIKLCHNLTFSNLKLRCVFFNDWVIAFSVKGNSILIEALLHKSRIVD
jgi:uncharacterized Fe-S radical SAM superfamily protein PflX